MRRAFGIAMGVLTAATAIIALAHVPSLNRGKSCPLGFDRTSPEQQLAARRAFARAHATATVAHARPALGFALDHTTRAEIDAWATGHHVTCDSGHGADLSCTHLSVGDVPGDIAVETLWLDFDAHDRLVRMTAFRESHDADKLLDAYRAVQTELDKAGAPFSSTRDPSSTRLRRGALAQLTAEYRFADYYAVAKATNMGNGRFVLIEEYRSLVL